MYHGLGDGRPKYRLNALTRLKQNEKRAEGLRDDLGDLDPEMRESLDWLVLHAATARRAYEAMKRRELIRKEEAYI
jgi:hypothetical protein